MTFSARESLGAAAVVSKRKCLHRLASRSNTLSGLCIQLAAFAGRGPAAISETCKVTGLVSKSKRYSQAVKAVIAVRVAHAVIQLD